MGFKRFSLRLADRLSFIFLGILLLGLLVSTPGYHAATILVLIGSLMMGAELYQFVSRTNLELTRFLDAIRYADFSQRFEAGAVGAGFQELGDTFTHIMDRIREDRSQQEREHRHLKALLEHVPVPLISILADGQVQSWNNSARRLFGSVPVTRQSDLRQFGHDFVTQVTEIRAGERVLATFHTEDVEQRIVVSASEITIGQQTERLISLQNIQSELDGVQLGAWQDLVRVLTHEIMNSVTPVSSLARTAVDLVDDARARLVGQPEVSEELKDVRDAVDTVARRSDGLMNFVSNYRQLTRPPQPEKSRFALSDLFADVQRIALQDWDKETTLNTLIEPDGLDLFADQQLVEHILINLLQNAYQATRDQHPAHIELVSRLNKRGRIIIEVADNGPGIPPENESRIFVPFYTTRKEGSGIGLALSRQIMIAHGGQLSLIDKDAAGARFRLVF